MECCILKSMRQIQTEKQILWARLRYMRKSSQIPTLSYFSSLVAVILHS